MSLMPQPFTAIAKETVRIAQAAFPKSTRFMTMRDQLGAVYDDAVFAELYPRRGQPAEAPWRLALVTLMPFADNLSDRQAADAVRGRIDWKDALALELDDPGFHYAVLSKFRTRLTETEAQSLLLDTLLERLQAGGWLNSGGRARTDSTHVLAAIGTLNRLENVGETLRAALNDLAVVAPDWLRQFACAEWVERYGKRVEQSRLPDNNQKCYADAEQIGADGLQLLRSIYDDPQYHWLDQLQSVETLRQTWIHQFYSDEEGQLRWR